MANTLAIDGTRNSGAVFVFGASRGIGVETGKAFAKAGRFVVFGCREPVAIAAELETLKSGGAQVLALAVDASDENSIEQAIEASCAVAGPIETLIYNAGIIGPIAPFAEAEAQDWDRIIDVNLMGCVRAVRAVLPHLAQSGRIILLSSGAARRALAGWSGYCVSKAGVSMFAGALALELEGRAFVCAVSPGMVDTDMQAQIRGSGLGAVSRVPKDQLTPPQAIAEALVGLATNAPASAHGRDIGFEELMRLCKAGG